MAATLAWTIDWLKTSTQTVNGFQEVVVDAGWRCTGTEIAGTPAVTYTNSIYGTCTFTEPPAGDPNFVPFADLTQAQVVGWCWENGVNQEATEAAINANLAAQITPATTQPPLPWATPAA